MPARTVRVRGVSMGRNRRRDSYLSGALIMTTKVLLSYVSRTSYRWRCRSGAVPGFLVVGTSSEVASGASDRPTDGPVQAEIPSPASSWEDWRLMNLGQDHWEWDNPQEVMSPRTRMWRGQCRVAFRESRKPVFDRVVVVVVLIFLFHPVDPRGII